MSEPIFYLVDITLPRALDDPENEEFQQWCEDNRISIVLSLEQARLGYKYKARMDEMQAIAFKLRWSDSWGISNAD